MSQSENLTDGNDIRQFIALSKASKGKALVAIVEKVLSHPSIFVFGELLDMPNVQQLQQTEFKSYYDLLNIFTFGSFSDYKNNKDNLPQLTQPMITKLRQLTIVFLSTRSKVIPYSVLLSQLDIQNVRELEDLIIDSIYQNIIKGKLDQKNKHIEIEFSIGRDVRYEQIDEFTKVLENWLGSSKSLLTEIGELIVHTDKVHDKYRKDKEEFESRVELAKQHVKPDQEMSGYPGGNGYESHEYMNDDSRARKGKKGIYKNK